MKNLDEFEMPLRDLHGKGYNDANLERREFIITRDGLDFLLGLGGNDASRIPRPPVPIAGAGQIALPISVENEEVASSEISGANISFYLEQHDQLSA